MPHITDSEHVRLLRIEAASRRYHDMLWSNTGNNADWPIHIKVDDDMANEFCDKLRELQDALKSPPQKLAK